MYKKFENYLLDLLSSPIKKKRVLWGTLIAFILSVALIPSELVLAKMLPGKNNDTYSIYVDLPNGSSIEQTRSVTDCTVGILQHEKEALDAEVFLGTGSPLDFAGLIKGSHFKNNENVAEVVVNLTKKHDRDEPSYMMVQRLRPVIQKECGNLYPGTNIKFVEPPAGPPTMAAIVAEVYGNNANGIRHLSNRIEGVFQKTEGLVDIDIMQDEIYDKFEVRVNTDKITRSALDVKHVNDVLYLAFEGMGVAVKNSQKSTDQIPIFLTLTPEGKKFASRDKLAIEMKLSSLTLLNQMGMMVPITEVVDIVGVKSNPMILSKNLHQMSNVVAETDMVSQVYPLMDARNVILDTFGDEYEIHKIGLFNLELIDKKTAERYELLWDGEMEVTLDTFVDLGGAFIAALILIFLLMVIYYKSFILSGIVLLGSFLSIIGVIFGHLIMDIFTTDTFFLTATSLIGFIALIGISSRNSLLLVDFTKSLMVDKGMHKKEAIAYATATRAKPIFLTAAAIILASTLLASDAVFGGLGVSLIFGTIAAVIASLVVVPVLIHNSDLERHFNFHERKAVSVMEP
ncbi:MAG: multidrug transporter AcrB [Sulfuricurvum sp. GWF2_44_89]|uniref:Multidrug transporter AcrB n=1 Tax=Sulfuricurvum kujiense TaxID=148813 RepID=A0A2D3WLZ8_9BACT|nr:MULTISPECIES: efflux RND transporter permease subunit [Sulfuricurvum]OHD79629.1 MAG: multidrug transporter AcrB [Sulfuricurvum sp. GWF2_44_89]OHD94585.1 MAG: multidrug transporter AcrB [Sulfuricurvum sp. RIFOXYD12_FULL_44_77]OHD96911.1 MAG: multidrug transporter AcrB [Sulfuricurvum sp. RIFOXYD2_FULL_44_160]DAB37583.1 MAG TPA: multidrug transporter AcrB [Sulfuricurvum kujiense]